MDPKSSRITLDLSLPPSVNRLWKVSNGKLYRSPQYMQWLKTAGVELISQKPKLPCKAISGPYSMILRLKLGGASDLDNRIKAVSDLLQAHQIIQNDNLCRKLLVLWDENLPVACRVTIRSIPSRID
jgi:Holliday junction resolvase RusA-like endonuclease